ncbi:hypothetical protein C8J57DRAFT_1262660 [Mycena rebaudengoi]|nr:hypothetical protein C8J57DRAFT_1262660 [Mycena rebaudengoi]
MSYTDTRTTQSSRTKPANVGADQIVQKTRSSTIPQGQSRYDGKDANRAPTVQSQTAMVEDRAGPGKAQGNLERLWHDQRANPRKNAPHCTKHPTYTPATGAEFEGPSTGALPVPNESSTLILVVRIASNVRAPAVSIWDRAPVFLLLLQ